MARGLLRVKNMQLPIEITYRGLSQSDAIDSWCYRLAHNKLERVCSYISRTQVVIERPHEHPRSGSGYRVRLTVTVPPTHEVVVAREPHQGSIRDSLYTVLQDAFHAARRQLLKLTEEQQGKVKSHVAQDLTAVVSQLFADHGFVETLEGREIYFHRNSVLGVPFEALRLGTGVTLTTVLGAKGPQASTLRVVDRRGEREPALPPVDATVVAQAAVK